MNRVLTRSVLVIIQRTAFPLRSTTKKFVEFHVCSHPCGRGDFKGEATSARSIMLTGKRKDRAMGRVVKEWKMKKAGEKRRRLKGEEIRRQ